MDYYLFVPFWAVVTTGLISLSLLFALIFLLSRVSAMEEDVQKIKVRHERLNVSFKD